MQFLTLVMRKPNRSATVEADVIFRLVRPLTWVSRIHGLTMARSCELGAGGSCTCEYRGAQLSSVSRQDLLISPAPAPEAHTVLVSRSDIVPWVGDRITGIALRSAS
jgi:hypothetical protein